MPAHDETVFVAMPFGTKRVGDRDVDFDAIYRDVFVPAVAAAGNGLEPKRADSDAYSAIIDREMYQFLELSRLVVADITGLNANVFYELGVRHRARPSGTVIVKQALAEEPEKKDARPFDIARIRIFSYATEPPERIPDAVRSLAGLIRSSLEAGAVDSPPHAALQLAVQHDAALEATMTEAENALRNADPARAIALYEQTMAAHPGDDGLASSLHGKIALLYRDLGRWDKVVAYAGIAVRDAPGNGSAWRDLGIAQGRIWARATPEERAKNQLPTGEQALRKATELTPDDYDAWGSLGGVLRRDALVQTDPAKRERLLREALAAYEKGADVSGGHPYPVLNALKLRIELERRFELTPARRIRLAQAERVRGPQADREPPYDAPWSCFDMADIALLCNVPGNFMKYLERGALHADRDEIESHLRTLRLLRAHLTDNTALTQGIELLEELNRGR